MKVQQWNIDKVIPYDKNVKNHDKTQVSKIAKSIQEFGWDQPIVVDGEGVIIKGHGRRLAAIQLGIKTVPVVVRDDLSPEAVKAARIADNRVAESTIDTTMLQEELRSIEYDLRGIFDDKELDFLTADLGELTDTSFVDDLDSEIAEHTAETHTKIEEIDEKSVAIGKALGFKSVLIKDEKYVKAFISILEEQFDTEGEEAFVKFAKKIVSEYK